MPSMTTTDQIKQRLASLLNDAYPLGIPTHTAIRDALAVIEQQEQQIAQRQDLTGEYVKGNEAYVKQLESQLREAVGLLKTVPPFGVKEREQIGPWLEHREQWLKDKEAFLCKQ